MSWNHMQARQETLKLKLSIAYQLSIVKSIHEIRRRHRHRQMQ